MQFLIIIFCVFVASASPTIASILDQITSSKSSDIPSDTYGETPQDGSLEDIIKGDDPEWQTCFVPHAPARKLLPKAENDVWILVVDGGGVRGIIPLQILTSFEGLIKDVTHSNKNLVDYFHLLAGTSVGSITVTGLTVPSARDKNHAKLTAYELMKRSEYMIQKTFKNSLKRTLRTLGGVLSSKYSAKPMEDLFKQYFGDSTSMSDLIRPTIVIVTDPKTGEMVPLSNIHAYQNQASTQNSDDPMAWLAVRASTAAPTYFKPLGCQNQIRQKRVFVDGGVVYNSPNLLALIEAMNLYPNAKNYHIVSLSTGRPDTSQQKVSFTGKTAGGIMKMLTTTINSALDGNAHVDQYLLNGLKTIFEKLGKNIQFHRINVQIPTQNAALDNANSKNLSTLKQIACDTMNEENGSFRTMLDDFFKSYRLDDASLQSLSFQPDLF